MKYRVIFRERAGASRGVAQNPIAFLQGSTSNTVVRSSKFVLRNEPEFKKSSDHQDDDAEFRHLGTEVWEYEVADGRDQEFKDALLNSGSIIEFAPIAQAERD
jgi:hypothetical protein